MAEEYKPAWLTKPSPGLLDLRGKINEKPIRTLAGAIWPNLKSTNDPKGSNQPKGKSNGK